MPVADVETSARPGGISPAEWSVRCDLAAAYQLIDLYGMSDLTGTHISARVPDEHEVFLLNPLGTLFDQITASSLIKVDVDGNVVDGASTALNFAGFVIHSAVHRALPHISCALHTHTVANNAVGAIAEGLLPITQKAIMNLPFLRYHDYEGTNTDRGGDTDLSERDRLVADIGDGNTRMVVLRNHGALTLGETIAEAWVWMYRLEMACRMQVAALSCASAGMTLMQLGARTIARTMEQASEVLAPDRPFTPGKIDWGSLLVKLEHERGTSYRT